MFKRYAMPLLTIGWIAMLAGGLLIFALQPPAQTYELSIWDSTPFAGWLLTYAATCLCVAMLLSLSTRRGNSRWAMSGVAGVISSHVVLLSLPALRGYVVSDRADAVNHIGYAVDILSTGSSSSVDFYPAIHYLQVSWQELLGLTAGNALIAINMCFALIWTLGIVLCVQEIAEDPRAGYVAAALSAIPALVIYHPLGLPSTLSAYCIPLLFGLHLARGRLAQRAAVAIAEILLAFLVVFFHPVTAFYLAVVLGAFEVAKRLRDRVAPAAASSVPVESTAGILPIVVAACAAWFASFSVITRGATDLVAWVLGSGERPSALGEALFLVEVARLDPGTLARVLFNLVGLPILIGATAFVLAAIVLVKGMRQPAFVSAKVFGFAGAVGGAALLAVPMFLVSSSERHPIRLLRVLVVLGVCLLAVTIWQRARRSPHTTRWLVAVGTIVMTAIFIGQANLYPHPRNGQPNAPVLATDVAAIKWLTSHQDTSALRASSLPEYGSRLDAMVLGYEGRSGSRERWWEDDIWIPTHFYEADWACIAEMAPGRHAYLILPEAAQLSVQRLPPSVRHLAHQYFEADYERLASDPTVGQVYDNGSVQIWKTEPDRC